MLLGMISSLTKNSSDPGAPEPQDQKNRLNMSKLIIVFCILLSLNINGQHPTYFSMFGTQWHEYPTYMFQGMNNDLIVLSGSYSYIVNENIESNIILIDSNGIFKKFVSLPDSFPMRHLIRGVISEYRYHILSRHFSEHPPYYTVLSILLLDTAFNILNETFVPYDTMHQWAGDAIMDSRGDYLFSARLVKPGGTTFPYVVKIDSAGNIKNNQHGSFPGYGWGDNKKIIEDFKSEGYFVGVQRKDSGGGDRILHLDSDFNILCDTIRFPTGIPHGMSGLLGLKKQYPDRIIVSTHTYTSGNMAIAAFDTLGNLLHFLERSKPGYACMPGMDPLAVTDSSIFFASYHALWGNVVFPSIKNYITVQKLDNSFQELWEAKLGWDAYFMYSTILATPDGGCIVLASVYDSDTMYMRHDVVLFKLDGNGQLVGVTNLTPEPDDLVVFPNPGTDRFEIKGADPLERVEVYDASGRLVRNVNLKGHPAIVDMHDAPSGLYIIRATSTTGKSYRPVKWVKR